jgi:tripartite ATP-independent transporter DctP family solute receptor
MEETRMNKVAGCILRLLLGGMAALAMSASLPAAAQETLRVAHTGNPGQSVYIYWDEFAKRVNEQSGGKLKVQVFGGGQLGGDEQIFRSLKLGTVQLGSAAAANSGVVTDAYFWADLPYVFRSRDGAVKVFNDPEIDQAVGQKMRSDAGTVVLGYIEVGGFRVFANTKRPLKTPDDVKGLKFRALSTPIDLGLLTAWQATPAPLAWSESLPAMQQGVVEGIHLQPVWIKAAGFGDVLKYATMTRALMTFHVAQINAKTWDSLSPDLQAVVRRASQEALKVANAADRADEAQIIESLKKNMAFYEPTPEEFKRWEDAGKAIWPKFKDKIDPKVFARVLAVQN